MVSPDHRVGRDGVGADPAHRARIALVGVLGEVDVLERLRRGHDVVGDAVALGPAAEVRVQVRRLRQLRVVVVDDLDQGPSIMVFQGLSAGKISHPLTFAPGPATPPGTPPTPPSVAVLPELLPDEPPLLPPDEPPDEPPLLPPEPPPDEPPEPPPELPPPSPPFEWLLLLLQPLENARASPVLSVSGQTTQWGLGFFLDMRGLPAKKRRRAAGAG